LQRPFVKYSRLEEPLGLCRRPMRSVKEYPRLFHLVGYMGDPELMTVLIAVINLGGEFVNNRINPALFSPAAMRLAAAVAEDGRPVRPGPHPIVTDRNAAYPAFGSFGTMDPDINSPRVQNWNVTLERQFSTNWGVAVSDLGTYSDRLWR
jgi:hypothetical protein